MGLIRIKLFLLENVKCGEPELAYIPRVSGLFPGNLRIFATILVLPEFPHFHEYPKLFPQNPGPFAGFTAYRLRFLHPYMDYGVYKTGLSG